MPVLISSRRRRRPYRLRYAPHTCTFRAIEGQPSRYSPYLIMCGRPPVSSCSIIKSILYTRTHRTLSPRALTGHRPLVLPSPPLSWLFRPQTRPPVLALLNHHTIHGSPVVFRQTWFPSMVPFYSSSRFSSSFLAITSDPTAPAAAECLTPRPGTKYVYCCCVVNKLSRCVHLK